MGWHGILGILAEERDVADLILDLDDFVEDRGQDLFLGTNSMMNPENLISDEEWEEAKGLHPILESIQDLIEDFEVQAANFTFPRGR